MVDRGIRERTRSCKQFRFEKGMASLSRGFLRNALCLLLLVQTPLEIPFSCRILSEVVNNVAVAADP